MATLSSIFDKDGGRESGLSFPAPQAPDNTINDLLRQNESSRQKLAEGGYADPTREVKPSVLERIFGPLDALGTGVRGLVYNAISDEDVNVWDEMGKALKGEDRVEGADILEELGVDNKWGKMLGGLAVDILLDPLTYLTLGYGSAAKAGGKGVLTAAAKYGDDAIDLTRFASDIGKNADEAADVIRVLKSNGLVDDAGRFLKGAVPELSREQSQKVMTDLFKQFGRGGVKFAGIPLGGDELMSKLGYAIKGSQVGDKATGLRALPGSKTVEQIFGMSGIPAEYADLTREGNEVLNTFVKAMRSNVANNLKVNQRIAERFGRELTEAIPDDAARTWASVAIAQQFGEDAPKLADLVDSVRNATKGLSTAQHGKSDAVKELIEQVGVKSRAELVDHFKNLITSSTDDMVQFRTGLLQRSKDNIMTTLSKTAGLTDEQVESALKGIDLYDTRLQELYDAQKERGILSLGVFGDDATGYLPGVSVPEMTDTASDVARRLGADVENLRDQTRETVPFLKRQRNVEPVKRKEFLTPVDRLLGRTREGDVLDAGLKTELDLSKLGVTAQAKQGGRVILKDFENELSQVLGNNEVATKMAKSLEGFFTDDDAMRATLRQFDKVTNWWKRQATILRFPAFSSRNFVSNKILMAQNGALSLAGEKKSAEILSKMAKYNAGKLQGAEKQAFEKEVDDLVRHGVLTTFDELAEQVGRSSSGKITKALGDVNTLVENQGRISAYHTFRNKGMGAQAAGEMVNKTLFDYSDEVLSVFERNVMKRLTPFYKWTKNNLSNQTRILLESPGRSTWLGHLIESGGATSEYDESVMPEWLRELNPVPLPLKFRGNPVMISTEGLFPQNDLEIIGKIITGEMNANDVLSFLNPLLRTPLEIVMNKDVYYDEDLQAYEGEKKRAPGYVEEFGDIANAVPGLREVWGLLTNTLGVQERESKDGEAYYWIDARAAKVLKDMLPWMNQVAKYVGGADPDKTFLDRLSATGVKPIKYDTEQFRVNKAYEDREALQEALAKMRDESTATNRGMTLQQLLGQGR